MHGPKVHINRLNELLRTHRVGVRSTVHKTKGMMLLQLSKSSIYLISHVRGEGERSDTKLDDVWHRPWARLRRVN